MSLRRWFNWLGGGRSNESSHHLHETEKGAFELKLDKVVVGHLSYDNGLWTFRYDEVYAASPNFRRIVNFPYAEKTYTSDALWSFFQIRIPGLKQPSVQEVIKKENLDPTNEAQLLRRFGKSSISNAYTLEVA